MSLWDILPCEIQDKIREESSSSYIQEIYRKNRDWYSKRNKSIMRVKPDYDGKKFRCCDRVLAIRKDGKLYIGTISGLSYSSKYYCRITLLDNKKLYYYKKPTYNNPHEIVHIKVINPWNYCICNKYSNHKCDECIINS